MAVALIVAAGRGERLGSGRPKALVTVAGRPMLAWSVEALRAVASITQIVIALPAEAMDAAPSGTVAVAGGEFRSQSVRNALEAADDGDPVVVHDAARPLAGAELFARAIAELETTGADAVVAAAAVSNTIKEVGADGRTVTRTLDRSRLWAVQTPQVFRRAALERVLREATDDELAAATDEASLIERRGGLVRIAPAPPENLKITTPGDLHVAEMLLTDPGAEDAAR